MSWFDFLFPIKLGDAEFVIVQPNSGLRIPIQFILESYRLVEQNDYDEVAIPGFSGEPIQFVKGRPKVLSLTLYFDSRNAGADVRQATKAVANLMNVLGEIHAPPVLSFVWKSFELKCVLEHRTEEFHSQLADGRPSRATMHVTLKEFRTERELLQDMNRQ